MSLIFKINGSYDLVSYVVPFLIKMNRKINSKRVINITSQ